MTETILIWAIPFVALVGLAFWGRYLFKGYWHIQFSRRYFKGLNYLLNEEQDKAIEIFMNIAQLDEHGIETHLALANLFRRRGEVDRAIMVHQKLIGRKDLSAEQRQESYVGLGQDYMTAGLLDRAEDLFSELIRKDGSIGIAYQHLLSISQQEKDWPKAVEFGYALERAGGKRLPSIIAQFYCEQAQDSITDGDVERAREFLVQALAKDPKCVRASLLEGEIHERLGDHSAALRAYKRVIEQDLDFASEVMRPIMACYMALNKPSSAKKFLETIMESYDGISPVLEMAEIVGREGGSAAAAQYIGKHLRRRPSVRGLDAFISTSLGDSEGKTREMLLMLQSLTGDLLDGKSIYRCTVCGFGTKTHHWQCPGCKNWNQVKPIHGVAEE